MATIKELKSWIEGDFGMRSSASKKVQEIQTELIPNKYQYQIKIYTFTNCYTITATERGDGGYLGCTAQARNDLPDGKLTKETWNNILCGIICYELEDISKTVNSVPDTLIA